jgi:tetratricopeptide (TPR) repeat protein
MEYKQMGKRNFLTFKMIYLILFTIFVSIPIPPVDAEIQTFVKEYTYYAGDEDSRNSCRVITLREVKRLLLEELGTYLESQTEVKNFQITKDQITTLTAEIVSAEVIEDKWDGKVYWLKAKIAANPQDVIKSIDNLRKDLEKVKELEKLRKKSEELLKENERLNKELRVAKDGTKQETARAYKLNIDNLSAAEWFEKGFAESSIAGREKEAIEALTKAIELDPRHWMAYMIRGGIFVDLKDYHQGIKDYDKVIELWPKDSYAYVKRGEAYDAMGNSERAIKDYDKAIEADPRSARAYAHRGSVYAALGDAQQAIKDFDKAITVEPKVAVLYVLRADVYYGLGDKQQAIKDYDKVIKLAPEFKQAYIKRGITHGLLGNHRQAFKDFDKAIALDSKYAEAYCLRAYTYLEFGDFRRSHDDFKVAAQLGYAPARDYLRSKGIVW